MNLRHSWNRNDPGLLREQPRQCDLCGSGILLLGDLLQKIHHRQVRAASLLGESRKGCSEIGGSVEEAQTLNIGGHNLPTLTYQQTGNPGGLYSPTSNYSFNYAPDLIAKAAYENNWGHFEVFGIGRFFRDRVFPNGPTPPGGRHSSTAESHFHGQVKLEGTSLLLRL
jgi:hypothetical protein